MLKCWHFQNMLICGDDGFPSLKQNCLLEKKATGFLNHSHPKGRTGAYSWATRVARWADKTPVRAGGGRQMFMASFLS